MSPTKKLLTITGWLLLAAIAVLSVVPSEYRPITPLPHYLEHASVFLLTGLAFGLGSAKPRFRVQFFALIAFSVAIELVQLETFDRHARLSDFIVDAISAALGVGLAMKMTRP